MTRPLAWMTAIRDHPKRPTPAQHLILNCLALRLDWETGAGFASVRQLTDDAGVNEKTVRRATTWARDNGFLTRTRRGHRINAETVIASSWRLTIPGQTQGVTDDTLAETQPDTGDRLGQSQPDFNGNPTGHSGPPNRTPQPPYQDLSSSKTVFIVPAARAKRAGTTCPRCGRANGTGHKPGCDNEDPQPVDKLLDDLRRELEPRRRPGERR